MKKMLSLLLVVALVFSFTACSGDQAPAEVPAAPSQGSTAEEPPIDVSNSAQSDGNSNVLVAYFSWADNAVLSDEVDAISSPSVVAPGNVQQLAGWVQEATQGDLLSIQVADPYPSDWDACLERANEERGEGARPELIEKTTQVEDYDVIFLGYPNWWYGVPMALLTFLEQNDFSGKQVYLFCSHGTGGLARSVEMIAEAIPDAQISDNIFDCYEEEAPSSQEAIQDWVAGLGYQQENTGPSVAGRQIAIRSGSNTVLYALNESTAADSLYSQLPLTLEVEDYSTNEKIFYPPVPLDTSDTPLAQEGAGTLAYYAPWGDIVLFYDDYSENPSLFALGQAISGADLISQMSGTITIEKVE